MLVLIPKNINDNFYKWFDKSKGIDETGKPIIFFHKSRSKEVFTNFSLDKIEKNPYNDCDGFYFVPHYHKHNITYIANGIELYVFLKFLNPLIIHDNLNNIVDMNGKKYECLDINKKFVSDCKNSGYDAIIIYNHLYYNQYIVFDNSQIKSIENNGLYQEDNNIFS